MRCVSQVKTIHEHTEIEVPMPVKNVVTWFDIPTADFDRAIKFYSDIMGEQVQVGEFMGQTLGVFKTDNRESVTGDIVPPGPNHKPSPDGTRIYLCCEGKLDQVISRVETAGGMVLHPRFAIGEAGWIAVIRDSEGNTVGLHSHS